MVMPVAESMTLPDPANSQVILLLARPGPDPMAMVKPSTAQPTACRSSITPLPGRICSTNEKYGSSVASPTDGKSGVQVYVKLGEDPDFTTLPRPKHTAQAPNSALRYFSSVPVTSQAVLNVVVANSWPLPYSAASSSTASFGLARAALSLFIRHITPAACAVTMSVCLPLPKQTRISCSLVADIFVLLLFGRSRCGALVPARHHQRCENLGRGFNFLRLALAERRC